MKNYFKKFSIMFVMLLAVIGFGIIQNGTVAKAATVGQQLTSPESGWTRYDDTNSNIKYSGNYGLVQHNANSYGTYNDDYHCIMGEGSGTEFSFIGTKLRIIGDICHDRSNNILVEIDGVAYRYDAHSSAYVVQTILFEKLYLENKKHNVKILIDSQSTTEDNSKTIGLDAIDIDSNGKLLQCDESITLDKSTMDLNVGDSQQLAATTTPAGAQITWTASDPSIATIEVDPTNGKILKVNALKEGTCTITATMTDGSNLSASCTVNVTKKDTPKSDIPTNTDTKTGAILIINLNDGETKVFDVSSTEVAKFKSWYNTKTEYENKLTYEFDKTVNSNISVEEHVVHEKITSFEVRKY